MLRLRGQSLKLFLGDGSIAVTGLIIGLAIPVLAPWWMTVVGVAFAVIVGKHVYGGLGQNLFNPAMVGVAALLVCYPAEMNQWPSLVNTDAISGATSLEFLKTELRSMKMMSEIADAPVFGTFGGQGWEWINLGFLLGGLWLLYARIANWQIPLSMLGSLLIVSSLFYMIDADLHASPVFHLFSGASIIGAFFVATDPVTAATTPRGRIIFGAGIGVLTYVIREWAIYPDGVAFAVLLMNAAVPMIDFYTRQRVLGQAAK
jgi:electron transport complex protein RnfD